MLNSKYNRSIKVDIKVSSFVGNPVLDQQN